MLTSANSFNLPKPRYEVGIAENNNLPCFKDEEIKVQRSEITFPALHSKQMMEWGFESKESVPRVCASRRSSILNASIIFSILIHERCSTHSLGK